MSDTLLPSEDEYILLNSIAFTHGEIYRVVDDFYSRIQNDTVLSLPFQSVTNWPEHIKRLTHFWWIRFGGRAYLSEEYNPVLKHFHAGFNKALLSRWLSIFHETLATHLPQEKVDLWTLISQRMGDGLIFKDELYRRQNEL
ncbi:MAG: group III truncated hemoglobin [Oligoflexia bacterium]|nr:group III truncated hemoglobin [Oligoflexia bacterium]